MKHWLLAVLGSLFLIPAQYANAETAPVEELITLAHRKFTEFSSDGERKAFETFFKNVQEGKKVDFSPDITTVGDRIEKQILTDPAYADLWDSSRVIKAEWLNWLCTDPAACKIITSKGIEIDQARISGKVDLAWLKLEFPIRIFKCAITDDFILNRASIRSLQLQGTYIKNLKGDGLNVDRDIMLGDNFLSQGEVWLQEASIGGSMICDDGKFLNPNGNAINLKFCRIGATARFGNTTAQFGNGFRAEGEVSLEDATVGTTLRCDGGWFINPKGDAISLQGARTGMVLLRNGFIADGKVSLLSATVDGNLDCTDGHFINPSGIALNVALARIQGEVLLDKLEADGQVRFEEAQIGGTISLGKDTNWDPGAGLDLASAKAKALLNTKGGWPPKYNLVLHGFTFEELDKEADLSGISQTEWIQRQRSDTFKSQPYEQMAKVFRDMGLEEEAIDVMIAKNLDHGNHLDFGLDPLHRFGLDWLLGFFWYKLVGWCIGFGYQPLKPFCWSLVIIGIGHVLFRAGYRSDLVTPTDKDAYEKGNGNGEQQLSEFYPRFNSFIYSLETFVPLLKLWMSDYWAPNSTRQKRLKIWNRELPIRGRGLRVYLWLHVAAGWILTSLWIGGLTGLLKT